MHKGNELSTQLLHLRVPAKAEFLSLVRLVVATAARNMGVTDEGIADIKVALSEASTNVIRHAYPSEFNEDEKTIEIDCFGEGNIFMIRIFDHGRGMVLTPPASEGLGFGIMGSLMDSVDVETSETGTTVLMEKNSLSTRDAI